MLNETTKAKPDPMPKDVAAFLLFVGTAAVIGLLLVLACAAFLALSFVWALLQILGGHPSPGANFLIVFIPGLAAIVTLLAVHARRKHR